MANHTYYSGLIRPEEMNSGQSYRVKFSYGTFSIAARVTQSGIYYYALKRANGKLHKVYVGRCGTITHDVLHRATMELSQRVRKNEGKSCGQGSEAQKPAFCALRAN